MDDDDLRVLAEQRTGATVAGTYRLLKLIGVGGMGAVYAAESTTGARVAMKMLHRFVSQLPGSRERFHREALIARRIDHAGVVRIFDDGMSDEGDLYIAMELLEGISVDQRAMQTDGVLPLNEVLAVVKATLDVLEAAHKVGVVHRDLKPENLFLTTSRTLKVLDFGIAKLDAPDVQVKRTRTGIIMGTPAFMAPEQARGRSSEVDRRTDIWAMGAMMFSLLSGRPVHLGEDVGAIVASAAIRPAISLARVVAAPYPVVRVVDRALSFDAHERYADASEMRAALIECVEELKRPAQVSVPSDRNEGNAPLTSLGTVVEGEIEGRREADPFANVNVSEEARAAMVELFTLLERAMLGATQYGAKHPETDKRIALAAAYAVAATAQHGQTLAWNVTPYSFAADGAPLWEPRTPFDRVPYQLFADGIRVINLAPGAPQEEVDSFLRLITKDRAREMAPEDDFVTLLWEAELTHVTHQAIDSFGEGDLTRRTRFETDVQGVQTLGRMRPAGKAAQAFAQKPAGQAADVHNARVLKLLSGNTGIDYAAMASAEAMVGKSKDAGSKNRALELTPELARVLAARLSPDSTAAEAKFVRSVALAWSEAASMGVTEPLASRLRGAIDGMATARPEAALKTAASLCAAAGEKTPGFAPSIVSAHALSKMIGLGRINPTIVPELRAMLVALDGASFEPVLDSLLHVDDGPLKDVLYEFLARPDLGNETRMGAVLPTANEEFGVAIIRALARIGTQRAKAAMMRAAESPYGIVRIEALGHIEGASSDRLRLELKALLEDGDPFVRISALTTIQKNAVRIAGPSLVLRVKSAKFDSLPVDERRLALETLAVLAMRRAEEVCIELVSNAGILPSEAREQTRTLAAEMLGVIGRSDDADIALEAAASSRWRSSEKLRTAATSSRVRLSQMPPAPPTSGSMPPPRPSGIPPKGKP